MRIEDVAIIGAGPAGIAAAIQLRRQGFDPIVFEKGRIGGLLHNANLVENYPGFPGGIAGVDLVALFQKQFDQYSIRLISDEVRQLDYENDAFHIETSSNVYKSGTAMIASGTKSRLYTEVDFPDDIKTKIQYEVYPIMHETGKRIIIVGAGDAAFDYALNLGRHNSVTILNRGKKTKCLPLLLKRAEVVESITYRSDTAIAKIGQALEGDLRIECMTPDGLELIDADYLLFAIGRDPQINFLSDNIISRRRELEDAGILYFLGDVKSGIFRQTSIAIGDAVMAAMKTNMKLTEKNR